MEGDTTLSNENRESAIPEYRASLTSCTGWVFVLRLFGSHILHWSSTILDGKAYTKSDDVYVGVRLVR